MEIYGWCVMTSHVHLIFRSTKQKPEELIRDFKSFTSKELMTLIRSNLQESRKEWLLNAFKKAANSNSNNTENQFWQQHNNPIELWSSDVIEQKLNYIHNNPVEAGFVEYPWQWRYSSAKDYSDGKGLVAICFV